MTDEISNKTLAILLVAAIAISLGGTFFSLNRLALLTRAPGTTGYITNPTGTAKVNVTATGSLRFSLPSLDFGIGYVNTTNSNQYCSMASGNDGAGYKDGVHKCVDFNAANTFNSLEIENDGNRNLTLTMTSNKNAADFIGGTSPGFMFYTTNNDTSACPDPEPDVWSDVNTTEMNICQGTGLDFLDTSDSMDIHLNLTIPYNSLTGEQTVTLTVTGTTVG